MATTLPTALDVHCSRLQTQDSKRSFKSPSIHHRHLSTTRPFKLHCSSSSKSPPTPAPDLSDSRPQNPSLSDQLKAISTAIVSDDRQLETQLKTKPKSTWVNPTRPKPSVLTLNRQKKSQYSYNPQIRSLKQFALKLNECGPSQDAFTAILSEIPHTLDRETALLLLNNLRPWQKTLLFFNWVKTQNLFPMETILYNVVMKSLRFGKQFHIIEELAFEMIKNEVKLDNITYSTVITSAKRCGHFSKALEWFERMYRTGVMPDEVTYSAVLDVYAKLGKVEEVMSLYDRGRASGWKPDPIAFSVLGKMFGEAGDYDGIRFVLQEMKSLRVQPNLVLYNTLLEALGKAGKPGLARSLFEEMVESGLNPDEKTLTALVKIYGKARWGRNALELWERMKLNGWPVDFFLYNTLLSMCADLGLVEDAEKLFQDMKGSKNSRPDSWSYTAMLNIYGSAGKPEDAMKVFDDMSKSGIDLNVMGCTCLIQCLGRARRIDDLVSVFEFSIRKGIRPDDRLCCCLMSVVSFCNDVTEIDEVLGCLRRANPDLLAFIRMLENDGNEDKFDILKEGFKKIIISTSSDSRRPFCNCLIDICRKRNLNERAHELLHLGTAFGLYPGLHTKMPEEWRLNVRSLSVGAALTAFEEWMIIVKNMVERGELGFPELFSASTGAGTHKFSQGLANSFESHVRKLGAPFRPSEDQAGLFIASCEDLVLWVQSKTLQSLVVTL